MMCAFRAESQFPITVPSSDRLIEYESGGSSEGTIRDPVYMKSVRVDRRTSFSKNLTRRVSQMKFECQNCYRILDTEDWTLERNEYEWIVCPKCATANEIPEEDDPSEDEAGEEDDD